MATNGNGDVKTIRCKIYEVGFLIMQGRKVTIMRMAVDDASCLTVEGGRGIAVTDES